MGALHTQDPSTVSTLVNATTSTPPLRTVTPIAESPITASQISIKNSVPSLEPYPSYIPVTHTDRTLVLCFDGTGDQFSTDNSNVIQLFAMLKKDDKSKQMVYYQSGIGTYTSPHVATSLHKKVSQTLDFMVATSLDVHVMQGYEFLMKNYTDGDRICLFGFSRGAYTARALAGMLHKVGLLPADNLQQIPFAYQLYTNTSDCGWRQSNVFKRAFSLDVDIHFIGVWDTVDSVGVIPRRLPFTTSNDIVRTFRHALSLDERRANFRANGWNYPSDEEAKLGFHKTIKHEHNWPKRKKTIDSLVDIDYDGNEDIAAAERLYSSIRSTPTDVYEVWFAGCHSDVGGGSVVDKMPHNLSRIPLRWMIRETFKADTGIMFNTECLQRIGLDPLTLYKKVRPRPPALTLDKDLVPDVCRYKSPTPPSPPWWRRLPNWAAWWKGNEKSSASGSDSQETVFTRLGSDGAVSVDVHWSDGGLREGTEEEEDLKDAMMPMYDQLRIYWVWWVLELIPLRFRVQKKDQKWYWHRGCNFGNGRVIPKQEELGVNIHRTVKLRMDSYVDEDGKRYIPAANLKVKPNWVD